jgi:hypothetical protein
MKSFCTISQIGILITISVFLLVVSINAAPLSDLSNGYDDNFLLDDNSMNKKDQRELIVLKELCARLRNTDEWGIIDENLKYACLLMYLNESDSRMNRERRFFALQVGKNTPITSHNDNNSNKGFKYGKK